MTLLVTGAGGYIGSVTTYVFLSRGVRVIAVDDFSTGWHGPLEMLANRFGSLLTWYERDIRNGCEDIFENHPDIDAVVHFAARCSVDESIRKPLYYFNHNVGGTLRLLKSVEKAGVRRLVLSSTCAVYQNAEIPLDEEHPCAPSSPYGQSKRIVEEVLAYLSSAGVLQSVILRYFNVCGASDDGLIGDSKKPSLLLVQNAVRAALGIEPFFLTCPTVETPDGTPIRDYVHVVDLADAHIRAVEYLLHGGAQTIVNIGTSTGYSVLEIVSTVERVTGARITRQTTTLRQGEMIRARACNTKAKTVLGWTPQRTIEDSVQSLAKWYTAHPYGWQQ